MKIKLPTIDSMLHQFDQQSADEYLAEMHRRIAANIRKYRKARRLTQKQMAKALYVSANHYSIMERTSAPNRNFTLERVLIACKVLGCSVDQLLEPI